MHVRSPGFFDLQVNGFAGTDFNSPGLTPDRIHEVIAALRATGVTRFLPTLITASLEHVASCAAAWRDITDPAVAGFHLEGPYISPVDGPRGAHSRPHCCAASVDDFQRRQDATGGRIVLVTLAPEVPGAIALIEYLATNGIKAAIGHTEASPALIRDAIRAGATLSTHLGNGCGAMLPRHPNFIWEQLAADELFASIIVDGHHLPPATVKVIARAKSPARTILVTDAMAAAGCAPGAYRISNVEVEVAADRRVSLKGTPYLAGSALTMDEAVANSVRYGAATLDEALAMASAIPARFMQLATADTVEAEWDPDRAALEIVAVTAT